MMKLQDLTLGVLADMLTRAQIVIGQYDTEHEHTHLRVDMSEAADLIRWEVGCLQMGCSADQRVIESTLPVDVGLSRFETKEGMLTSVQDIGDPKRLEEQRQLQNHASKGSSTQAPRRCTRELVWDSHSPTAS
jgi:hypothetical protein